MIKISFQTKPVGRYPTVALEIACHTEEQSRKFVTRIDRKQFDVTRELNNVYLWDRERIPKKRYLA